MNVRHKTFGTGKVKELGDNYIIVSFGVGEKKFQFPQAFQNFLSTDDPSLLMKIEEAKKKTVKKPVETTSYIPQVKTVQKPRVSPYQRSSVYSSSNPLVGPRAQTIDVYSQEEMFELVGYMAAPGRVNSFEAEVPKDGRDDVFESLFPGQKYRPIEMGDTPSGMPNKLSPQFRINFGNLRNCPLKLKQNMGKGNGACVGRINKSKFVISMVQDYGFRFGEYQDVKAIRDIAVKKGYAEAFDRGYSL